VAVFAYPLIAAVKRNVNYIIRNHRRKGSAAVDLPSSLYDVRRRSAPLAGFVSPVSIIADRGGIGPGMRRRNDRCRSAIDRQRYRGRDNAAAIPPGMFRYRAMPPRRLLPPRARTCAASRHECNARWWTPDGSPSPQRGLAYFFADDRDLTGCRYYAGHCCRASGFVHRLALTFRRSGVSLSLSLSLTRAHVRAHAHTHTHIGRSFRSADPILYLLYRGDQSRRIPRACAARNERSPVLSVFPSVCPEDRSPSIPPTRSPLVPLLGSPSASTSSSSFLLALLAAFLRSLLGSLAVRSRDCRPGQIRPHLDTHAPRGAPFAPFLRDSFNDRHDRSPLILLSARSGSSMNEDGSAV